MKRNLSHLPKGTLGGLGMLTDSHDPAAVVRTPVRQRLPTTGGTVQGDRRGQPAEESIHLHVLVPLPESASLAT